MRSSRPLAALALLVACGGAPPPDPSEVEPPVTVRSEAPTDASQTSTVPVAEPLGLAPPPPPLPPFGAVRNPPSVALVDAWRAVQRVGSRTPPPLPPDDGSLAATQRWAEGDFAAWLEARREAALAAERTAERVAAAEVAPPERGVAAGLLGWLFDQFAYDLARTATVPDEILGDAELLAIYADAIFAAARPLRERATALYRACADRLDGAAEGWWSGYRRYCADRARVLEAAPDRVDPDVIRARVADGPARGARGIASVGPLEVSSFEPAAIEEWAARCR